MAILISKKTLRPVVLFIIGLVFVLPVNAEQSFSNLFIFGDSMSDTGNLASVMGDFPPVYYNNRVSNGPVAVEVLGKKLGLSTDASLHLISQNFGTNYAVASATAGGDGPFDLNTQVNAFLSVHEFSAPENALYVVFVGGNDIRGARDLKDRWLIKAAVKNAADNVKQNISKLIGSGAQFFIVINSLDVGRIPEALLPKSQLNNSRLSKRTTRVARYFNRLLKRNLRDIETEFDMEIAKFDSFRFLNRVIARAKSFGFSNTSEPCFLYSTLMFHSDCNFGESADTFLFFDDKHTSAKANILIGDALFNVVMGFDWKSEDG